MTRGDFPLSEPGPPSPAPENGDSRLPGRSTENRLPVTLISRSPGETVLAGESLASFLRPGSVVALRGGLGAGKTWFCKGVARALGVEEEVTSPTYTIVSEYPARTGGLEIPLYHIDAWRLEGDAAFAALDGDAYLDGGGVALIEWADHIEASIPRDALWVDIEILEDGNRRIQIEGPLLPAGALQDGGSRNGGIRPGTEGP